MIKKDIHFFKPHGSWQDAKILNFLEPKKKQFYNLHIADGILPGGRSVMACIGENCPICQAIKKKKTLTIRIILFYQDIIKAFKRLFI